MAEKQYHRIRMYPGTWSTLDMVEACAKPKWCCGCQYNHAFCTELGGVINPEKYKTELEAERSRYGKRR